MAGAAVKQPQLILKVLAITKVQVRSWGHVASIVLMPLILNAL